MREETRAKYLGVDWAQPDDAIAEQVGITPQRVRRLRRELNKRRPKNKRGKSIAAFPCPKCGDKHSRVSDSRFQSDRRWRRRTCGKCSHRFSTVEHMSGGRWYQMPQLPNQTVVIGPIEAAALLQKLRDATAYLEKCTAHPLVQPEARV